MHIREDGDGGAQLLVGGCRIRGVANGLGSDHGG